MSLASACRSRRLVFGLPLLTLLFAASALFVAPNLLAAPQRVTTLAPGDIAVIGYSSDDDGNAVDADGNETPEDDEFALLALVDIEVGTQISITDKGVASDGTLQAEGESVRGFVTKEAISAGEVFIFTRTRSGEQSFPAAFGAPESGGTSFGFGLSTNGDQITVFQENGDGTNTFIYSLSTTPFNPAYTTSPRNDTDTALPPGLVNGVSAIDFEDDADVVDNVYYDRANGTSGTRDELLALVSNDDNYVQENTGDGFTLASTLGGGAFTVASDGGGITLPVTFEEDIDYEIVGFAGAERSEVVTDPFDATNRVVRVIRSAGAETFAGTVVANNGLAEPIPFMPDATTMSVRVWTPVAGTPVRIKVENSDNGAVAVESQSVSTTVGGMYETLEFDFADGSPAINFDSVYDKLVIFFDFGTAGAAEATYYFDDFAFGGTGGGGMTANLVINEVDSDTPFFDPPVAGRANDDAEFIELFNADMMSVDLSDYVLVLFNGSDDQSYESFDLDGTVAPGGYYVVCSDAAFVANCDLAIGANTIQNGADAVALYLGSAADFPNDTPITTDNLVDVVVYDTNDDDDTGLLAGFGETTQYNEGENGNSAGQAILRQPDGSETFVTGAPTPGVSNGGGGGGMGGHLIVRTEADEDVMNGQCSLREAIRTANSDATTDCGTGSDDNDLITFHSSVTTITLTMGEMLISDDVTIDGLSATGGKVVIDAGGGSRIFDVATDGGAGDNRRVRFTSLVLRNGDSGQGGSSAPDAGGAVDLKSGSAATFTDVDVTGSVAGINGGGIHGAGDTDIVITSEARGSLISNNEARGPESNRGGGGVWGAGSVTIMGDVTIDNNRATGAAGSGGGVFNLGGTLVIGEGVEISNNKANRAGGGIEAAGGTTTLTGVMVMWNSVSTSPGNGAGLHGGGDAVVNVTGGRFFNNEAGSEGGALWISGGGTMTVTGTEITSNTAFGTAAENGGGGLYNDGGTLTIVDAVITKNIANRGSGSGGGILNNGGILTITGGQINKNHGERAGGGIESAGGTVSLEDIDIEDNLTGAVPGNGGGVHAGGATDLTMTNLRFRKNRAVEGGGFWISGGTVLTASNLVVEENRASGADAAQGGGGFYNEGGRATIEGSLFRANSAAGASGSGGAILNNNGMLILRDTDFLRNRSNRAGGAIEDRAGDVATGSMVMINNSTMTSNNAGANPGNGGAVHVTGAGRVTIDSSRVAGNTAAGEGGGLWNFGTSSMTVSYTSVTRNMSGVGGGLYQQGGDDGLLLFSNGLVAMNEATAVGGGVAIDGATVQIVNSTISSNVADTGAGSANRGGRLLLSNVTVANNRASTSGGGLANLSPDFGDGEDSDDAEAEAEAISPDNTIVGSNSAPTGADLFGPIMSRGYNLFETTNGSDIMMDDGAGDDLVNVDSGLQRLADNGGPTQTHAIREDSPAVNAGWTALTIDQRGAERRGTPDIGAFESDAAPTAGEDVAMEFADGEDMRMSPAAPNPLRNTAKLAVAVRQSQSVRVVLYDVMGRQVGVLHDGPMAASTAYDLTVDASALASGVYVVVVRGESIQGTQRITVAR